MRTGAYFFDSVRRIISRFLERNLKNYYFYSMEMVIMKKYFTRTELCLWLSSAAVIVAAFLLWDGEGFLTLAASLIGVSAIIMNAKGNPIGQVLMVVFSLLYGIISYSFAYYGEMLTYLGMTMPMSVFALVSWLKNPYKGKKSQVRINRSLKKKDCIVMTASALAVTAVFYFVLEAFDTANIVPSTISVTTSFVAVYLTYKRSPYFSLGYAANDVVLIALWTLASLESPRYIAVTVCFVAFLANDIYGFFNWRRLGKKQELGA